MPTIHLTLPKLHSAQLQIGRTARRFNTLSCGRRFGKTLFGEDRAVKPALAGFPVGWFAPSYKYLMEVWRDFVRLLAPVVSRTNAQEKRIELITGGFIEFWSLEDLDAGRSRKYKRVVVDEAAKIPYLKLAWQEAIRATLTDYLGDAWFLSTPKGRNFFFELFQKGVDPLETEYAAWQMPTSANPFIKPQEIEKARLELPERVFQQEYLAEFLEDAGGVFRRVRDAALAHKQEKAIEGHSYVIGVDWAKRTDFSVFTVIDETLQSLVYLDRSNGVDYTVQRNRLAALSERFRPHTIVAELNSIGEPNIEVLQREGLPVRGFQTTNASKANAIETLALAFERDQLRILNDAVLINELESFESETLPSGLTRYAAPEGTHDDCVMSLAMAFHAAKRLSTRVEHGEPLW